jgi:hypothetical protein
MKSMCDYPFALFTDPNQPKIRPELNESRIGSRFQTADATDSMEGGLLSRGMLPRIGTGISGTRSATKNYQTINGNPSAPNDGKKTLIKQAEFLDENRIVLYKKGM